MLNPKKVRNQNRNIVSNHNSRGFALLMMLSIFIIAFTAVAVVHLSKNNNQLKQKAATLVALTRARDAIMAYSVSQMPAAPPGTLPCPDINGDGISDPAAAGSTCSAFRGLVPFQTLGLAANTDSKGNRVLYLDGTGAPIWYVVPQVGYTGPVVGVRNSSLPLTPGTNLTIFVNSLGVTQSMAFILIAPGMPINGQQPTTSPVLAPATEFLEGENGNNSLATYDDLQDATHNDQLMGMPVQAYWTNIETFVLAELKSDLNTYNSNCGKFPWAAIFGSAGDNSTASLPQGGAPLGTANPIPWGGACVPANGKSAPSLPAWFSNWTRMIYYAMCNTANPPTTSCISLVAPGTVGSAKVILMAPGISIGGLPRGAGAPISNFYEGVNNIPDNIFNNLRPANHTPNSNDLITIVAP